MCRRSGKRRNIGKVGDVCVCVCFGVCVWCSRARLRLPSSLISLLDRMRNSKELKTSSVEAMFAVDSHRVLEPNQFYFLISPLPTPPLFLPVSWTLSRNARSYPSQRLRCLPVSFPDASSREQVPLGPCAALRLPLGVRRTLALAYTNSEELRLCLP